MILGIFNVFYFLTIFFLQESYPFSYSIFFFPDRVAQDVDRALFEDAYNIPY